MKSFFYSFLILFFLPLLSCQSPEHQNSFPSHSQSIGTNISPYFFPRSKNHMGKSAQESKAKEEKAGKVFLAKPIFVSKEHPQAVRTPTVPIFEIDPSWVGDLSLKNNDFDQSPQASSSEVPFRKSNFSENLKPKIKPLQKKKMMPSYDGLLGKYEYVVEIDGKPSGKQVIEIQKNARGEYIMKTDIEMSVDFLLFFSYNHKHKTIEVWKAGELISLLGETDDNGDVFTLNLAFDGTMMSGQGPEGKVQVERPHSTNNAWNLGMASRQNDPILIMNPETGELQKLPVKKLSEEKVLVDGKEINCERIQFSGKDWKFWFAPEGYLVKQTDKLMGYSVEIRLEKIFPK